VPVIGSPVITGLPRCALYSLLDPVFVDIFREGVSNRETLR
jgi:hypothetical protein